MVGSNIIRIPSLNNYIKIDCVGGNRRNSSKFIFFYQGSMFCPLWDSNYRSTDIITYPITTDCFITRERERNKDIQLQGKFFKSKRNKKEKKEK